MDANCRNDKRALKDRVKEMELSYEDVIRAFKLVQEITFLSQGDYNILHFFEDYGFNKDLSSTIVYVNKCIFI